MIGRPEPTEAAEYYFTYINEARGQEPLAIMTDQLDEMHKLAVKVSEERSLYRYAPGKWSIRQVLNHCSDTERVFASRALWFARGLEAPLPSYDQDVAARTAEADAVPWSAHVDEFHTVRLASISLFRNLPADAWLRTGVASEKRFTVRSLAFIIPGHVEYHLRALRERYL
jgi:hypothetical protein